MVDSAKANTVQFQSTLSVRRATTYVRVRNICMDISIHALRKESDHGRNRRCGGQSISIHALRKESDDPSRPPGLHEPYFNPRSP